MADAPAPRELAALAEALAREAGALLRARFEEAGGREVHAKSSPTDLASDADLAAEALIRERLAEQRPGDAILGEEGGGDEAAAAPGTLRWIVDPLDGTTNFLFGVPQWCVSVACEDDAGAVAAVVFDPLRGDLFAATRDGATTLGGVPVVPAPARTLAHSLVATGFSYDARERGVQGERIAALLPCVRDIRRMGAAALDLAWVAAGRYDAFVERGLAPWDVAAGVLLVARAGLEVRRLAPGGGLPAGVAAGRRETLDALESFGL